MSWWRFWQSGRGRAAFQPMEGLPNPEHRAAAYLDAAWLREARAREGVLEALRESRALLSDQAPGRAPGPEGHIGQLKDLFRRFVAAEGDGGAAAARALRESVDADAPGPLREIAARGAAALDEDPALAGELRLFLRAIVYAYRFHANLFGLRHRLDPAAPRRGVLPAPTAAQVVFVQTYRKPVRLHLSARVSDAELEALARLPAPAVGRLDPADASFSAAVRAALRQGLPSCVRHAAGCALIAAWLPSEEWVIYDPILGSSGRAAPADLAAGPTGADEIAVPEGERGASMDDLYAEPALL